VTLVLAPNCRDRAATDLYCLANPIMYLDCGMIVGKRHSS
jgi:hypothetical protein